MKQVQIQSDSSASGFEAWREEARRALRSGYGPGELDLQDAATATTLSLTFTLEDGPSGTPILQPHVPKAFLQKGELVAAHRNPQRWNLLYRILHRLQSERTLLGIENDHDVAEMVRLAAHVSRDLSKMRVLVRFHKVMRPGEVLLAEHRPEVIDEAIFAQKPQPARAAQSGAAHHLVLATATPFGVAKSDVAECTSPVSAEECDQFIAWYQPEHRILPLAAPFFANHFAIMRWSILTPDASVSWDPVSERLIWSPGLPRETAPDEEDLEAAWRSRRADIYNQMRALRGEMTMQRSKSHLEVPLFPSLSHEPDMEVASPATSSQQKTSALPFVPPERTLTAINGALPSCKGCDLYRHATQVVGGTGPSTASILVVGEQPGDREDIEGIPFVGPAGRLLNETLAELGIDRSLMYVTNAVKHFKFMQRGKLRLHQNPRMSEITACRPWLLAEIEAVRPKLVLCLGASAAKSLLGSTFGLMKQHGEVLHTPFADKVMATLHPSAILRAQDEPARIQMMEMFKADLAKAASLVTA